MAIRCPTCKKSNSDGTLCQRCGTDLNTLAAIHSASQNYMERSRQYIILGKGNEALNCAQRAWELEHTRQAAKLAFLSCLLLEYFDKATQWYIWANHK